MRNKDIMHGVIVLIIILIIGANINEINSFLSFKNEKSVEFGHSVAVIPAAWSATDNLNLNNVSKTEHALTNNYVYIDHWDNWPEDHISSISESKLKTLEDGGYEVLKNDSCTLNDVNVSKQYFTNPSRESIGNASIGVNYVFPKEDTNYCIQVHYFTRHDYNNTTFTKELDNFVGDYMINIHNKDFNGFYSGLRDMADFFDNGVKKN